MGYIRHPRVYFSIGGATIAPTECTVHVSQHQSADTFSGTFPLDFPSASFWCDTAPLDVTVMATNDYTTGGWTQMITGSVDDIEADFEARTVRINGRDKTAELTDKKTTEKWLNKKPEEVIKELAGRVGLGTQIKSQSKDKAGLQYKQEFNRISEYDNSWNVIVRMAKQMGCVAFVKGQTLYVQPYDQAGGGIFLVQYIPPTAANAAQSNVISLGGKRNLHLSKDVKVNHKSWRHQQGEAIESEFRSTGAGSAALEYTFKGANLTKQQQDELAQSKLNEILSHERNMTIAAVGDVSITPFHMAQVVGTGTGFDQQYIISSIEHRWEEEDGYTMDLEVRNKDSKRGSAEQVK